MMVEFNSGTDVCNEILISKFPRREKSLKCLRESILHIQVSKSPRWSGCPLFSHGSRLCHVICKRNSTVIRGNPVEALASKLMGIWKSPIKTMDVKRVPIIQI